MAEGGTLPELRCLLIGRTGHGKSSTGNSILGQKLFEVSDCTAASCTKDATTQEVERFGWKIRVTDTPGYFDTDGQGEWDQEHLRKVLMKCVFTTIPGIDAIFFVLKLGEKFTPELQRTQELFYEWFGPGVGQYAFLVITHCDTKQRARQYAGTHASLHMLATLCGNRIFAIGNKCSRDHIKKQIIELLKPIMDGKKSNKRPTYKSPLHEDVSKHIIYMRYPDISCESLEMMTSVVSETFIEKSVSEKRQWKQEGNLKILDDSESQSGLYHLTPPRNRRSTCASSNQKSETNQDTRDRICSAEIDAEYIDVHTSGTNISLKAKKYPHKDENRLEMLEESNYLNEIGHEESKYKTSSTNSECIIDVDLNKPARRKINRLSRTFQDKPHTITRFDSDHGVTAASSLETGGHEEVDEETRQFRRNIEENPSFLDLCLRKLQQFSSWIGIRLKALWEKFKRQPAENQ